MQAGSRRNRGSGHRALHEVLTPARIAGGYLVLSALWILFSDRIVEALAGGNLQVLTRIQTAKGLFFIGGTTTMLYLLMRASRQALLRSEEGHRQMFELSSAVCLLLDASTGRIVDANAAATEFYGWSRAELLRRRVHDINTMPPQLISGALIAARRPGGEHFIVQHRTASGAIREVEVHSGPVDVDGRPMLFSIVHDMTARVAAERALEESEERYRTLLAEAPDGFLLVREDGSIADVNPAACAMLGYGRAELLALRMDDLAAAEGRHRREAAPPGGHLIEERMLRRKDGTVVHVEVSARRRDDGLTQALLRDVSTRRSLEEQLRQAQKMEAVGQLTGGIAHDLNNVLGVVIANADLIRHALPAGRDEIRGDLEEIKRAARRGADMIRKLLGFSRQSPIALGPVDLGASVAEIFTTLRRLLPSDISIDLEGQGPGLVVRSDRGALEQILVNLATNARDAMPEGGRMVVRVSRETGEHGPDEACVTVEDTGVGMDRETASRVFEPFFTTKPPDKGSGLGLAMVYGIVRQMAGTIRIDSTPGKGTAFRIAFPVLATAAPGPDTAPAGARLPRGTETILLVEDELMLRSATSRILRRLGYTVLAAADGEEALDLFRLHQEEIRLVLSDVVMPRRSGPALYEALRTAGHDVPFLLTSGYSARGEAPEHLLDNVPMLSKPWSTDELAQKVRELLDAA